LLIRVIVEVVEAWRENTPFVDHCVVVRKPAAQRIRNPLGARHVHATLLPGQEQYTP